MPRAGVTILVSTLAAAVLVACAQQPSPRDGARAADGRASAQDGARLRVDGRNADGRTRSDGVTPGRDGANAADSAADRCARALICDHFDKDKAGSAPGSPWTVSTAQGSVRVDTTRSYSGNNSVLFRTDTTVAGGKRAQIRINGKPLFPVSGNSFYGRMMIWLASLPSGVVHWSLIRSSGTISGSSSTATYNYGTQRNGRIIANYYQSPSKSDCWKHSATTLPVKRWACIEWQYKGPANTMKIWIDGKAITDVTVVNKGAGCLGPDSNATWTAPQFDMLALGWQNYAATGRHDLWIDDVAIDTQRIPCPPKP